MTVDDDTQPTEPQREPDAPPPEPPPAGATRRLTRAADDRVLGGVAGGLGRYFGIDPIIPRIAFAALVFAGGFGILAYAAAWLFVPDEETGETAAGSSKSAAIAGIAVLIVAIGVLSDGPLGWWGGPGFLFLVVAGVVALALYQAATNGTARGTAAQIALFLLAGLLAISGTFAVLVGAAFGGGAVIAGGIVLAGLLVAAGASSGRLRWLLVPAVVLAIPLGIVAAADMEFDGGVGQREYRPATVSDLPDRYELGMGELVVDLREVALPDGMTDLGIELGAGHAIVLVDEDVCVRPDVTIGAGDARVLGRNSNGIDVQMRESATATAGDVPVLALDADLGFGQLEVVSDPVQLDDGGPGFRDHRFRPFDDDDSGYAGGLNAACAATVA